GLAALLALNAIDPDAIVARVNLDRARALPADAAQSLDLVHLATLRGGGVELATPAIIQHAATPSTSGETVKARCEAARGLLKRWGASSTTRARLHGGGAWRFWNHDDVAALDVVAANEAALRAVESASCVKKSEAPTAP